MQEDDIETINSLTYILMRGCYMAPSCYYIGISTIQNSDHRPQIGYLLNLNSRKNHNYSRTQV